MNTLGAAQYRAGCWRAAVETLEGSVPLMPKDQLAFTGFILATSRWQFDQRDQARECYRQSLESMERYRPKNAELKRFRAKAAGLLGIAEEQAPQRPEEAQPLQ